MRDNLELTRPLHQPHSHAPWAEQMWHALNAGVVRKYGPPDVEAAIRAKWLEAAEQALQRNRVTFALLPMSELLRDDGYLTVLRQRGYQVVAPDDVESADAAVTVDAPGPVPGTIARE